MSSSDSPRRVLGQSAVASSSSSAASAGSSSSKSTSSCSATAINLDGLTTTASLLIVPDNSLPEDDHEYATSPTQHHHVLASLGSSQSHTKRLHPSQHQHHSQAQQHQQQQLGSSGCSVGVSISTCSMSTSTGSSHGNASSSQFASSGPGSSSNHSSTAKKSLITLNPATNFEAFSLHFHLPLKAAAEKFGVRATAFKKRCRAIGIRHWPYRKVRSLKRSLQELNRCKDQGTLNEKQQYQYATFKKQLDKLMSPETYGIDPSGRLVHTHHVHHSQSFDDDEDDSGEDDTFGNQDSPRFGATFTDCIISPADNDKPQPFPEFPASPHMRLVRKTSPRSPAARMGGHGLQGHGGHLGKNMSLSSNAYPDLSNVTVRVSSTKESPVMGGYGSSVKNYPFGVYEQYLHDSDRALLSSKTHTEDADDLVGCGDHPSSGSALDNSSNHGDFIAGDIKYDDVRSLHEADEEFHDHSIGHLDYSSERFFDDVFLQISPDYGCLV